MKQLAFILTISLVLLGQVYAQDQQFSVFIGEKISFNLVSSAHVKADTIIGKRIGNGDKTGSSDTLVIIGWQEKNNYILVYKVTEPLYGNSEIGDTIQFNAFSDSESMFYDRALLILRKRNDKYHMERIKQWDEK